MELVWKTNAIRRTKAVSHRLKTANPSQSGSSRASWCQPKRTELPIRVTSDRFDSAAIGWRSSDSRLGYADRSIWLVDSRLTGCPRNRTMRKSICDSSGRLDHLMSLSARPHRFLFIFCCLSARTHWLDSNSIVRIPIQSAAKASPKQLSI